MALTLKAGVHLDFPTAHVLDAWRVVSPLAGFGVTVTLMGLQKEIAWNAEMAATSKHRLVHPSRPELFAWPPRTRRWCWPVATFRGMPAT